MAVRPEVMQGIAEHDMSLADPDFVSCFIEAFHSAWLRPSGPEVDSGDLWCDEHGPLLPSASVEKWCDLVVQKSQLIPGGVDGSDEGLYLHEVIPASLRVAVLLQGFLPESQRVVQFFLNLLDVSSDDQAGDDDETE